MWTFFIESSQQTVFVWGVAAHWETPACFTMSVVRKQCMIVQLKLGRVREWQSLNMIQHCKPMQLQVHCWHLQSLQLLLQTNNWIHYTFSCCAHECDCSIGPVENCVCPENVLFGAASAPSILVQAGEGISSLSAIMPWLNHQIAYLIPKWVYSSSNFGCMLSVGTIWFYKRVSLGMWEERSLVGEPWPLNVC